jgi:protein involved in sex pheromone biosynthesis
MKVEKRVTTRYKVDLLNAGKSAATVAAAINQLEKAGVRVEKAEFIEGNSREFFLQVVDTTYYDDSTLKRMEAGTPPRYEVKIDTTAQVEDIADKVTKHVKRRESLDPRY